MIWGPYITCQHRFGGTKSITQSKKSWYTSIVMVVQYTFGLGTHKSSAHWKTQCQKWPSLYSLFQFTCKVATLSYPIIPYHTLSTILPFSWLPWWFRCTFPFFAASFQPHGTSEAPHRSTQHAAGHGFAANGRLGTAGQQGQLDGRPGGEAWSCRKWARKTN